MNSNIQQRLLSIIIPIYKAEDFIARCLDSIYNQGVNEDTFEVIAVNDGTPDGSMDIVGKYAKNHCNLRIFNKENGGVSTARNLGLDVAQGDYVLFVDADDELVEGAFSKLCDYLAEHEPMNMLMTRQLRNDGTQEWLAKAPSLKEHKVYTGVEAYKSHFVRGNAGGGICRMDFLQKHHLRFPEGVRNSEDSIFFILVQVYAQSIVYYNLDLYRIFQIKGSASRVDIENKAKRLITTVQAVVRIKSDLKVEAEQKAIFDYMAYKSLSDIAYYYASSKRLTYTQLIRDINPNELLPLDLRHIYMKRDKIRLMNISYALFYFFSWISHKF